MKINPVDKVKLSTKTLAILKNLKKDPKKQEKLIRALQANGFEDIAELAIMAQKYLEEV